MSAVILGSDTANKILINDLYRQMNRLVSALDGNDDWTVMDEKEVEQTEEELRRIGAIANLWLCVSIRRNGGEPLPESGDVWTLEEDGGAI